jgi:hypothetical protein
VVDASSAVKGPKMTNVERFHELCRQAEAEKDPSRLDEIAKRMLDLLQEEALRLLAREHDEKGQMLQTP